MLGPLGLHPGWVSETVEMAGAWKSHSQLFLAFASLPPTFSTLHRICFQPLSGTFQLRSHYCWVGMGLKALGTLLGLMQPVHGILFMTDMHVNTHTGNILAFAGAKCCYAGTEVFQTNLTRMRK